MKSTKSKKCMKSTKLEDHLEIRKVSCKKINGKIYVLANDNEDIRVTVRKYGSPCAMLSPVV
jgi:hypothetical protein